MNYDIAAKPTLYRGYRFRSRLEARWAVFFDLIKVQWEYEPASFDTENGQVTPDFILQCPLYSGMDAVILIEVKPISFKGKAHHEERQAIMRRYSMVCDLLRGSEHCVGYMLALGDPYDALLFERRPGSPLPYKDGALVGEVWYPADPRYNRESDAKWLAGGWTGLDGWNFTQCQGLKVCLENIGYSDFDSEVCLARYYDFMHYLPNN